MILGSGGFEKNLELREKHHPHPTSIDWTTGSVNNTGGGILAGIAAGADTDLLDDAWWGPTIPLPSGPWFCLAERNLPGSIIVNQAGRRYMNEALPYVEAVHAMYDGEATGVGHVPSWMVIDQRYRNRYLFAGLTPRQPFPGHWYKNGVVHKADSLAGLADAIGVPPDALAETVDRFNGFARNGTDEDFHRGESGYDRYYSDPTVKPNPSLHTIDQGPFYAVKIVPGDLGTKGGLVTDERAARAASRRRRHHWPVRRRQRVRRRDGPHLRGTRRDHRTGAGVRLRRGGGHRREGRRGCRLTPASRSAPSSPTAPSPGPSPTSCSTTSASAPRPTCGGPWKARSSPCCRRFGVVVPTFHETDPPPLDLPGCDIDLAQVVHGSQTVEVSRPDPDQRLGGAEHHAHRCLGQGLRRRDLAGGDRP